jgi:hypothetical protein
MRAGAVDADSGVGAAGWSVDAVEQHGQFGRANQIAVGADSGLLGVGRGEGEGAFPTPLVRQSRLATFTARKADETISPACIRNSEGVFTPKSAKNQQSYSRPRL